jgi:hypothetical protein
MTRDEIQAFFAFDAPLPHFGANSYAVPSLAWLTGPFWSFFRARLWNENLDKWQVRFECRDFARAYAAAALECWALTQGGTADDGLAVGEIWFIPNAAKPNEGHAICPVFTEHGLQFIEPQTGQLYPMTAAQISSRYFLRF